MLVAELDLEVQDVLAEAHESKRPRLDDAQLGALRRGLERRFGKNVETSVSIDSSLIGGAKIVIGDTVIDATVRGELQAMANQLQR